MIFKSKRRTKMHMIDWNAYRGQINAGVRKLGELSPDTVRGYLALSTAGQKTGRFDGKTRELIAVAVAITLRCDGCIAVHTEAALKFGADPAELAEAMGVAISVNAGASIIYATRSLDAFAAAGEAKAL
jgi:AhpD family alkylhydroperoxidase